MIRMPRPHLTRRSRLVAIVAAVVFLFSAGSISASAYWTGSSTLASTVSPAALSLTLANVNTLATEWKFAGVATNSPIVRKELTITNTGAAPLTYTLAIANTSSTLAAATKLWLWTEAGCATPSGTAGTLAAPPALLAGAASAASGVAVKLCAATQLTTTVAASQGLTNTASVTVTGRVGTNWTTANTTATATQAIQSVYRVPPPTNMVCTTGFLGISGVNLSWTGATGATGYTITGNGNPTAITTLPSTTTSVNLFRTSGIIPGSQISVNGATILTVTTTDSVYGTTSTSVQVPVHEAGVSLACG